MTTPRDGVQIQPGRVRAVGWDVLETYVHWLPKQDRPRGVVGNVLTKASKKRGGQRQAAQDRA